MTDDSHIVTGVASGTVKFSESVSIVITHENGVTTSVPVVDPRNGALLLRVVEALNDKQVTSK